jgi:predicted transcriptional regulator
MLQTRRYQLTPVSKRSKADIYYDVLDLMCQEGAKIGRASPTRVAHRANLPYDRFQKILDHFMETGLVQKTNNGLLITENGLRCLHQMQQTNEFLRRMGLNI